MSYFIKIKTAASALIKRMGKSHYGIYLLVIVGVIAGLFGALFVFIPEQAAINGLNTIDDALSYAHNMPELPPMDNTNMVRPDYGLFHRANNANYFVRKWRAILTYFHLSSAFTWSPVYFKSLLELTATRLKSYKIEKNILYKIKPTPKTRFVVIGDLSGAYHSLTRDLEKLCALEILDRSLKIMSPETFIVFMGDAISRSPYGMETLGLIVRLMEMNPEKVVYMRGNHEDNKYWEAFGLKDQLDIRFGLENSAPIVSVINTLFMRLPIGLYIPIPEQDNHFLRISHLSSAESSKLKEDNYAHFLEAKQQSLVDRYEIDKTVTHNNKIVIDAVINSEKKRHTFQVSTGMRQLPPDGGAIAWTLLSAPTLVNQKGLKFVDDAFAIIQLAETKEDWKITLYSQNAVKQEGFTPTEFQFFTGAPYAEKKKLVTNEKTERLKAEAAKTEATKAGPVKVETVQQPVVQQPAAVTVKPPIKPLEDILTSFALKRAIKSHFIQRLITPRRRPQPVAPVVPAAKTVEPEQQSLPATVNQHGISFTIGTPTRNKTDNRLIIPISVSVAEQGEAGPSTNELATQESVEVDTGPALVATARVESIPSSTAAFIESAISR